MVNYEGEALDYEGEGEEVWKKASTRGIVVSGSSSATVLGCEGEWRVEIARGGWMRKDEGCWPEQSRQCGNQVYLHEDPLPFPPPPQSGIPQSPTPSLG